MRTAVVAIILKEQLDGPQGAFRAVSGKAQLAVALWTAFVARGTKVVDAYLARGELFNLRQILDALEERCTPGHKPCGGPELPLHMEAVLSPFAGPPNF